MMQLLGFKRWVLKTLETRKKNNSYKNWYDDSMRSGNSIIMPTKWVG